MPMQALRDVEVAILLATHNGARFVEQQVRSLGDNTTRFVLHWLDDHSADSTVEVVRAAARTKRIALKEWHYPERQGVPGAFFRLLECVQADIYLFCDQDDIWQPGKIDVTVTTLLPDLQKPVLCTSDPLMFRDDEPNVFYPLSQVVGSERRRALQESRLFMSTVAQGHTQGLTRPLRDMFLAHKEVAQTHAVMHDMWMYAIAVATGTVRMLSNVPTTLYRWHTHNASDTYNSWHGPGIGRLTLTWQQQLRTRRALARHAQGFILASRTLPPSPKLQRLVEVAHVVAKLDQWHSPGALLRLARLGAMWPNRRVALGLAASCLLSAA